MTNYMRKPIQSIILLFLLFLVSVVSFSQLPDDFPVVTSADLPDAKFSSPRIFNSSALFGYINGGAELYLEYGFSTVSVTEIEYLQGKYKTEVYKMNGPEEAFGIFSVSKYRCLDMPALAEFTCRTKYQLQICKGPYYISIINGTGSKSDSIASVTIGKILTGKIRDQELDLTGFLPGIPREVIKTRCILAKGKLGIMNGSPDQEEFFQGITGYTAVIVKSEKTIISVRFVSDTSFQCFLDLHKLKDETIVADGRIKKISSNHLIIEMTD
jgi:hypothetical protein